MGGGHRSLYQADSHPMDAFLAEQSTGTVTSRSPELFTSGWLDRVSRCAAHLGTPLQLWSETGAERKIALPVF